MTEELSPEFLEFSAWLDQDEAGPRPQPLRAEQELLLDLRNCLQGLPELDLAPDFARTTATQAVLRYQAQSPWLRGLIRLEPALSGSAWARPLWLLGVAGLGLGSWAISWHALAGFGLMTLLLGLLWLGLHQRYLKPLECKPAKTGLGLAPAFYALPVFASASSAVLAGLLLSLLGRASYSFHSGQAPVSALAVAGGLALFFLLVSGMAPLWKAVRSQIQNRPGLLVSWQILHAAWLAAVLIPVGLLVNWPLPELWVGLISTLSALVASKLAYGQPGPRRRLWSGLQACLQSFLWGGLPILTVLILYYQVNLTRSIDQPKLYVNLQSSTRAWLKFNRAIPADLNGWTLMEPVMGPSAPQESATTRGLQAGKLVYDQYFEEAPSNPKAEEDFESQLPLIRQALERPYFSTWSNQEFSLQARCPNYVLARDVSRGLSGLAWRELNRQQSEAALDYILLNLRWSSAWREGALLELMSSLGQFRYSLPPLQRALSEHVLTEKQLRRLQTQLQHAQMSISLFTQTMDRYTFLVDETFQALLLDDSGQLLPGSDSWQRILRLVPKEYWESERKTFLNLHLEQAYHWNMLTPSEPERPMEILPIDLTARQIVPVGGRVQLQFMLIHSRISALQLLTGLELYRLAHDTYPDRLEALIPKYCERLPRDAMQPNHWDRKPTFGYRTGPSGCELISTSPLYEQLHLRSPQIYGKHGVYSPQERPDQAEGTGSAMKNFQAP